MSDYNKSQFDVEGLTTPFTGSPLLDTATILTTARTVVLNAQGVRAQFQQSTVAKVTLCVPCKIGVFRHHQTAPEVKQPLPTHQRSRGKCFLEMSSSRTAPPPLTSSKGIRRSPSPQRRGLNREGEGPSSEGKQLFFSTKDEEKKTSFSSKEEEKEDCNGQRSRVGGPCSSCGRA